MESDTGQGLLDQPFQTTLCLFCNEVNSDLDDNLSHMLKMHGLFIPDKDLQVELETLLSYSHLVIFGYHECLWCGSQRSSAEAVQQHMMDKGHCRIDTAEGSDFHDFLATELGRKDDEGDAATPAEPPTPTSIQPDDTTIRLSSGKVLTRRSVGKPRPPQPKHPNKDSLNPQSATSDPPSPSSLPVPASAPDRSSPSRALTTRAERRASAFTDQLARLRAGDRYSLAHLPASQQRSLLANRKKQMDQARKAEMRIQSRVASMGNKTLMKHFVMDVPGPANG